MAIKIKDLPEIERPYEKFEKYGERYLSDAELLAIIIKTGTKQETAVSLAQRIINLKGKEENLMFLQNLSIEELTKVKGIGKIKAIQLKSVCELARRMSMPFNFAKITIKTPKDVANLMNQELRFEKKEIVKVVLLNTKNIIQKIIEVTQGGINSVNLNVKDIFVEAIKMQVPKIIIVHNHPSGDPTPSMADYEFTKEVIKASKILGIEVLDHIVIGNDKYESIMLKLNKAEDKGL